MRVQSEKPYSLNTIRESVIKNIQRNIHRCLSLHRLHGQPPRYPQHLGKTHLVWQFSNSCRCRSIFEYTKVHDTLPLSAWSFQCAWVTCCGVDILAILDGFAFRLQVLLASFYPQFADKRVWVCDLFELIIFFPFHKTFWQNYQIQISISVFGKLCVFGLIGFWLLPIGAQLSRDTMRQGLLKVFQLRIVKYCSYPHFSTQSALPQCGDYVWRIQIVRCVRCSASNG